MDADQQTVADSLQAGQQALATRRLGDCAHTRRSALAEGESAAALDGLGWAGWWLADEQHDAGAAESGNAAKGADDAETDWGNAPEHGLL